MPLKDLIYEKIVKPYNDNTFDTVVANIVSYNNIKNKASIEFQDPKGSGLIELDNVPVQLGTGGVHSAGPFVGDQVWVSFVNKSLMHPKIVSLCDEKYVINTRNKLTHTRKGSYLPEQFNSYKEYNPNINFDDINPISDDWIDYDNTDSSKYAEYTSDPVSDLITQMSNISNYNTEEPGITHPLNSSTMKIKNNGAIDVFVSTNQGVRIDPQTKTISIFGIEEKHHVTNLYKFVDENINTESKELNIKNKNTSIETDQLNINSNVWNVNSTGDIKINSSSNITIESTKDITLKGSSVKIDGNFTISRDNLIKILNQE